MRAVSRSIIGSRPIQLAAVLKAHSGDPLHGGDALALLHRLRSRADVMFEVAVDIDAFLRERSSGQAPLGEDDEMSAPEERGVPVERLMTEFRRLVREREEEGEEWRQSLLSTFLDHSTGWKFFCLTPDIPAKKLRNARAATGIGEEEEPLSR